MTRSVLKKCNAQLPTRTRQASISMPLLRVIVTCILLCLNENVIGQRYLFQNYGVSDGLAFQECRGIVQDKHGFIWISHTDGLSRFDGYNFKIYKYNPN